MGASASDARLERLLSQYGARLLPAPAVADDEGSAAFVTYAVRDIERATEFAAALRSIGIDAFRKPGEELP